jgi:hypothetical protein
MKKTTTNPKRAGTKAAKKSAAGKTARKAETFKVPRSARHLAAAIQQRMKRSPDYWAEVRDAMLERPEIQRAAQVVPRETHATH